MNEGCILAHIIRSPAPASQLVCKSQLLVTHLTLHFPIHTRLPCSSPSSLDTVVDKVEIGCRVANLFNFAYLLLISH